MVGLGKSGVAATLLLRRPRASGLCLGHRDRAGAYDAWAAHAAGRSAPRSSSAATISTRIGRAAAVVVAPGVPPDVPPLAAARRGRGSPIYAEVDIGLPGPPRHPLHRDHRDQRQDHDDVADRPRARRRRGSGPRRRATSAGRSATWRSRRTRRDWLALELSLVPAPRRAAPPARDRRAHQPRAQPPRPVPLARGVLRRQGAALPERRRRLRSGSPTPTTPAVQAMVRAGAGHGTSGSRSSAAPTAGTIATAAGSCWATRALMPARGAAAPGRPQRRQRARRRAGGRRGRRATRARSPPGSGPSGPFPHRVEPIREVDGVLWINDSKSTNITSTEVAIAALDRPFVLLLGGRHKGEPYTRLAEPLQGPLPGGGGLRRGRARWSCRIWATALTVVPAGDFDEVLATARAAGPAGRCGAAVARLLQLRHVQELRGARRALPRRGRGDVTGPRPVRHPGRAALGDPAPRRGHRWSCSPSASPPPTARPAWSPCRGESVGLGFAAAPAVAAR